MKTHVIAGTVLLALSILFSMIGASEGAQEPNPLFLEARNLWQQLGNRVFRAWSSGVEEYDTTNPANVVLIGSIPATLTSTGTGIAVR